jgi:hypothetical protein
MFNIVNIFSDCFINNFHGLGRSLVFSTTSVLFNIMMIHKHGGQYGDNSDIVGVAYVMPLYLSANLLSQAGYAPGQPVCHDSSRLSQVHGVEAFPSCV